MTPLPGRIVWLAVIAGLLADLIVSLIISLVGYYFDPNLERGLNFASTAGVVTTVFLTFSTCFGGWLAGRIAKHEYVLHGMLVGGISLLTLLFDSLFVEPAVLFTIVHAIVLVFAGALGGYLSRWLPTPQQHHE